MFLWWASCSIWILRSTACSWEEAFHKLLLPFYRSLVSTMVDVILAFSRHHQLFQSPEHSETSVLELLIREPKCQCNCNSVLFPVAPPLKDQKKPTPAPAPKSFLPKPGQSGLRPPGYSRLAPARLAAFSFVRSASISSASSNQSNDSTRSDPCRPVNRKSLSNPYPTLSPIRQKTVNIIPCWTLLAGCPGVPCLRSLVPYAC